jgi:hypothetical protein
MYPRTYYETFMRYEVSDEIFVAMPFTEEFERSFRDVIDPAIARVSYKERPLKSRIINRGTTGSADLHERIFDAIIHSRLVIADMTVQSSHIVSGKERWQANANVAYEVGLATSWRNQEDILLIHRPHPNHVYAFDVQHLRHIEYRLDDPEASQISLAMEIARALDRSVFIAHRSFDGLARALPTGAVRMLHIEASRVFPVLEFSDLDAFSFHGALEHGLDQLLQAGAIKTRNAGRHEGDGKRKLTLIYQWTELGYRLMRALKAADDARILEIQQLVESVGSDVWPPLELLQFVKPPAT